MVLASKITDLSADEFFSERVTILPVIVGDGHRLAVFFKVDSVMAMMTLYMTFGHLTKMLTLFRNNDKVASTLLAYEATLSGYYGQGKKRIYFEMVTAYRGIQFTPCTIF